MVTKCPRGIRLFFSYTVAWYTNHDACCSFLCGNFCASLRARAWGILAGMSRKSHLPVRSALNGVHWTPPPPSKAQREKPAFFLTGGQSLFYGLRFSAETLFSVPGFAGLRGRGRGLSLWRYPIMEQERKTASPASASPWRTPANRSRTRLFSAPNSPAFRGSQQPLGAFPLEEPGAIFPHPAARIDKEKGPWYNVHDPTWVALVFACWLAQGLFSCHQAAPGRMTRDGR